MPGIRDESDGAIQQAPHPMRQEIISFVAIIFMVVSAPGCEHGDRRHPITVTVVMIIPSPRTIAG